MIKSHVGGHSVNLAALTLEFLLSSDNRSCRVEMKTETCITTTNTLIAQPANRKPAEQKALLFSKLAILDSGHTKYCL